MVELRGYGYCWMGESGVLLSVVGDLCPMWNG